MGWAADHPVTVGTVCLALGVLAVFDATRVSVELMPELNYPRAAPGHDRRTSTRG